MSAPESIETALRKQNPHAPGSSIKMAAELHDAIAPLMDYEAGGMRQSLNLDADGVARMFRTLHRAQDFVLDEHWMSELRTARRRRVTAGTHEPLVGLHFHTFDVSQERPVVVEYQGRIDAHVGGGFDHYLVTLYDWIVGVPGTKCLLAFADFVGGRARFYDSADEMRDAYEAKYRAAAERAARRGE